MKALAKIDNDETFTDDRENRIKLAPGEVGNIWPASVRRACVAVRHDGLLIDDRPARSAPGSHTGRRNPSEVDI